MANLIYRAGTMSDLEQLQALKISSYSTIADKLPTDGKEALIKSINNTETLRALISIAHTFVCEHDKQIVGMAYLVPAGNPTHIYPADWCYIRMLGVHPDHQGRGIARILTGQCIGKARSLNETTVALHTSEVMDAARHIYEGMGFKIVKEIDRIFGVRYWLYALDLTADKKG